MLFLAIVQVVCASALAVSLELDGPVSASSARAPLKSAPVAALTDTSVRAPAAGPLPDGALSPTAGAFLDVVAGARDWTAKTEDSICGLRDLAQVSNPVVIDFQACLDATPEMKKIKAEKIDPKSPDGIRLTTEATNRVTQACESVQKAHGYCSVWKSIKHKDGRAITDVSSQVTALF